MAFKLTKGETVTRDRLAANLLMRVGHEQAEQQSARTTMRCKLRVISRSSAPRHGASNMTDAPNAGRGAMPDWLSMRSSANGKAISPTTPQCRSPMRSTNSRRCPTRRAGDRCRLTASGVTTSDDRARRCAVWGWRGPLTCSSPRPPVGMAEAIGARSSQATISGRRVDRFVPTLDRLDLRQQLHTEIGCEGHRHDP